LFLCYTPCVIIYLLKTRIGNDIFLAVYGEVSPSALGVAPCKTVRGTRIVRRGQIHPAGLECLSSCAVRESRERYGVFGVRVDAVSPCTVHPRRPQRICGMPPNDFFKPSEHGSCYRPASPLCHNGDAQSRQARVFDAHLSAGAPVNVSSVEGVLSTTPTRGTPNHPQFSALSYRRDDPRLQNSVVRSECGRIHARPSGRDSLLESGSNRVLTSS